VKKSRRGLGADWPDVLVSTTKTSSRISAAVRDGRLRKIGPRLYSSDLTSAPSDVIRRNLWRVVSLLAPLTVVSHRSAIEMQPADDGSIILSAGYERRLELPGLTLRFVEGPGPLPGDTPLWELHLASRARALLESLEPSRARRGVARGLTRTRVAEELERDFEAGGEEKLTRLRDDARMLAPLLGLEEQFEELNGIVDTLLSPENTAFASPLAAARPAGPPYDRARLDRFQTLFAELKRRPVLSRQDATRSDASFANIAFFDAYFSNLIDGIQFEADEAHAIVFDGRIPDARPEDAHDLIGTFRLVGDRAFMSRGVRDMHTATAFEDALRGAHAEILSARPGNRPGQFRRTANGPGATRFVEPELVSGTLHQALDLVRALDSPFHRAVMMMFMLSDVHPFDDGNGRIARAFMNAELASGGERRILIPIVCREDFLTGLRTLTRQGHPNPLIAILDFAQKYTTAIDFSDYGRAVAALRSTNAFAEPRSGVRLRMPRNE
jgi:hypothetical protein